MKFLPPALVLLLVGLVVVACATIDGNSPKGDPMGPPTKQELEAISPQEILDLLVEHNAQFARGEVAPDSFADVHQTASGQYPYAAILTCIDSRVPVDIVFNAGVGALFSANNAGNVLNPDITGSLEFACGVAGSKLILVLGHTSCGAVKGACDGVKLGSLTQLLAKIQPAIDSVPDDGTPRTSKNAAFTRKVLDSHVRLTLQRIRDESPLLSDLEQQGKIMLVSAVYDVKTGLVTWNKK